MNRYFVLWSRIGQTVKLYAGIEIFDLGSRLNCLDNLLTRGTRIRHRHLKSAIEKHQASQLRHV